MADKLLFLLFLSFLLLEEKESLSLRRLAVLDWLATESESLYCRRLLGMRLASACCAALPAWMALMIFWLWRLSPKAARWAC